jgi:hypothetical protein
MAISDPTHLSCVANDYGADHVFSRVVEAFAGENDMVFLLSTRGTLRTWSWPQKLRTERVLASSDFWVAAAADWPRCATWL